jgi:hypothetical protein
MERGAEEVLCPHCSKILRLYWLNTIVGDSPMRSGVNCVVFACQACKKAISLQLEPTEAHLWNTLDSRFPSDRDA